MQFLAQGTGYSRAPGSPRAIMVRVAAVDFLNIGNNEPLDNLIPDPDGYDIARVGSTGTPAAVQVGYRGASCKLNLVQQMQAQGMAWLSSVYIDNSLGAGVLIVRHAASGLKIAARPFTQGHYPLVLPEGSDFSFDLAYVDVYDLDQLVAAVRPSFGVYPDDSTTGAGIGGTFFSRPVESGFLRLQFTDVIVPPAVWGTRNEFSGTYFDHSITLNIASGFVSVLGMNQFRKGWLIQNQNAPAGGQIFIIPHVEGGVLNVANSIRVGGGGIYEQRGFPQHVGNIYVAVDVDNTRVIVKELQ